MEMNFSSFRLPITIFNKDCNWEMITPSTQTAIYSLVGKPVEFLFLLPNVSSRIEKKQVLKLVALYVRP